MRISPPWSALLLVSLCSCGDEVVVGNGRLVETRRSVEPFSRIAIDNSFRVQVDLGKQSVTLLLDDNLEPHVRTRVVLGELWLQPDPHLDLVPSRGTLLDIVSPAIRALEVANETLLTGKTNGPDIVLEASDQATLDVEALDARTVSIEASGQSRVRQTGSGRRLLIEAAGEAVVQSEVSAEEVEIQGI